jgi:hypothetical protein
MKPLKLRSRNSQRLRATFLLLLALFSMAFVASAARAVPPAGPHFATDRPAAATLPV